MEEGILTISILVAGIPTPLKNDGVKVSWGYEIPNMWENKTCSKPPTSIVCAYHLTFKTISTT